MYCEQCQGPVRDEENYFVIDDHTTDLFFCNEQEARDWLEDHPEKAASIIIDDPELAESVGW